MNNSLALILCLAFVVLALWHFYMALLPQSGKSGAVPSIEGKPLFIPSRRGTALVGVALAMFGGLVAATSGIISVDLSHAVLSWLSYALATGLIVRAVGEFKYVGFFKRVRGSKFATLDTFVYSPLCLLLGSGVAFVAWH